MIICTPLRVVSVQSSALYDNGITEKRVGVGGAMLYVVLYMCSCMCMCSWCPVPAGSPSRGGDVKVYVLDINQPSLPTPFTLFLCLFLSYGPFTCTSTFSLLSMKTKSLSCLCLICLLPLILFTTPFFCHVLVTLLVYLTLSLLGSLPISLIAPKLSL